VDQLDIRPIFSEGSDGAELWGVWGIAGGSYPWTKRAQDIVDVLRASGIEVLKTDADFLAGHPAEILSELQKWVDGGEPPRIAVGVTTLKKKPGQKAGMSVVITDSASTEETAEHEMWHVVLGDVFKSFEDVKNAVAFRIANEAFIEGFVKRDRKAVYDAEIRPEKSGRGWKQKEISEGEVPNLHNLPFASVLKIVQDHLEVTPCDDSGRGGGGCGVHDPGDCPKAAGGKIGHHGQKMPEMTEEEFQQYLDELRKVQLKIRAAIQSDRVGGLDQMKSYVISAGSSGASGRIPPPPPLPATYAEKILRTLKGKHYGIRRISRTWSREGHFAEVRGVARFPKLDILVAVDASGSMLGERLTVAAGIATWIGKTENVRTVTFDDEVHFWRPGMHIPGGGGTLIGPVLAMALNTKADALVVITDAEIHDIPKVFPDGLPPIFWITPKDGAKIPLRGIDHLYRDERLK
jgi:hypothetical protein